MNPPRSVDVAILGAGIVGAATAYHAARAPGTSVVVVDRPSRSRGATGRSAGILTLPGWDPWDLALVRQTAAEYGALSESVGRGNLRANGGLRVARTDEGAEWLRRIAQVLERSGVPFRHLDAEGCGRQLPGADFSDVRAGLHTPDDCVFDPGEVTAAYLAVARARGAEIDLGASNVSVTPTGAEWVVSADGGSFAARRLVIACGAWTPSFLAGLGYSLPIVAFRSHALELRPRPLAPAFPTLHDLDLNLYARPGALGRVLVGDGTERRATDPDRAEDAPDGAFAAGALRRLAEVIPGWAEAVVERAWAGLCVSSPDRYPLVGRVPGAPRLYVATGFNGLGAMRAGAIGRLLAEAILRDRWASLTPADPARFSLPPPPFEPCPEFPLEPEEWGALPDAVESPRPAHDEELSDGPIRFRALTVPAELDGRELPSLSDWFDPYLRRFAADSLRVGGEVHVAEVGGDVRGLYLYEPVEGIGSLFTRVAAVAHEFLTFRGRGEVYADRPWRPGGRPLEIMAADLRDWRPAFPTRHPVRIASAGDLPKVRAFLREVTGNVDERWFRTLPRDDELCFFAEVDGRVAGVSWATVEGPAARGHTFEVGPRYRGIGIGTDLLQARQMWLRDAGVRLVVSEIYAGNRASATAAERAGMSSVGQMYHYRGTAPTVRGIPSRPTSGGPRTSDTRSPSNR